MIFRRQELEAFEDQMLAPYAVRSKNSKGLLYIEEESAQRTAFQRDRDRIIHTTAFRRLEYKTQVFINHEGDYYRTRLTHTIEVAQIGRSIARGLGANEDLTETICLSHDLGHPPFGHSGERVLNQLMLDYGGFEHNKHTYRIVTDLEKRYPEFSGLNLSWETLEGIVKHESEYDSSDAKDFNPDLRGHLEAQICNIADELAYTAHDLDDGLRSGMIHTGMLEGIELWEIISNPFRWSGTQIDELSRHQINRELIGYLVSDVIQATEKKILESKIKSVDELQRLSYNVLCFSDELQQRLRVLKDFLYKNLYRHYRVQRMAVKADRILTDMFKAYQSESTILPQHIQGLIEDQGLERTICDYIAGMTDRYAIEEYQKLFDPKSLP
ncbi:MAG: deoxyguanosinetriphosphate triphosphohydrolase [Anaerolineaceae bacterium]|nr:deoxyguanosinetriphosphate triphosphohydrolase [Anaerolineaceae bacterium]